MPAKPGWSKPCARSWCRRQEYCRTHSSTLAGSVDWHPRLRRARPKSAATIRWPCPCQAAPCACAAGWTGSTAWPAAPATRLPTTSPAAPAAINLAKPLQRRPPRVQHAPVPRPWSGVGWNEIEPGARMCTRFRYFFPAGSERGEEQSSGPPGELETGRGTDRTSCAGSAATALSRQRMISSPTAATARSSSSAATWRPRPRPVQRQTPEPGSQHRLFRDVMRA